MEKNLSRRDFMAKGSVVVGGTLVFGTMLAAELMKTDAVRAASAWDQVPGILSQIVPPTFPAATFDITKYGAVGDGTSMNTAAFKKAIAACNAAGGGHVIVPAGKFLTGAIHLLSNVDLHLNSGATIAFSTNPADFLPVVFTRWQGIECMNYSPFIYAYHQTNVAITGTGTIDGQAHSGPWFGSFRSSESSDFTKLEAMADNNTPVAQRIFGAGHGLRPTMIEMYSCTNVLISDVTVINTPFWHLHPTLSSNVTVKNVTVTSTGSQTDGCDPESCNLVHIQGCKFSVGDDCIAIKAGRNADGRRVNVPTQNVVIEDCDFIGPWGAIAIGSEMTGGVENVFVRNCTPHTTSAHTIKYVMYFKTNSLRGGFIRNINVGDPATPNSIVATGLQRSVMFLTFNFNEGAGHGFNPIAQNINVANLTVNGAAQVVDLEGYSDDHIQHIHFNNCAFNNISNTTNTVQFVDDLTFTNCTVNGKPIGTTVTNTPTFVPSTATVTPTVMPTTGTPQAGLTLSGLTVSDTANASHWSIQSNLKVGDTIYGDRAFTFAQVPSIIQGAAWIQTANASKTATQNPLVKFTISQAATVYVGMDNRLTKPSWLDSSWANTGQNITLAGDNTVFTVYSKPFAAGSIALGPDGSDPNSPTSLSMYTIAVK